MAGDLANRDITAGAPSAIKDMLYGDTHVPNIIKAYKGETLIFERNPDNWLYHIENVNCDKTHSMSSYDKYQPENIYYIGESILPMSYENIYRDWEVLINVSDMDSSSSGVTSRIPIFTETRFGDDDPNYQEYTNTIGGPEAEFYIALSMYSNNTNDKIKIYGTNAIFSGYGPNDHFSNGSTDWIDYNKSLYGSISGKDIRIFKTSEFVSGEKVHKIEIYISGLLMVTLKYDPFFSCSTRVGSIMRRVGTYSGNGYFDGKIKYFKFRFNSDPAISDFTMHNLSLPDYQIKSGSNTQVIEDEEKVTTTTTTICSYGTTYCIETIKEIQYFDPNRDNEQTHSVTSNRGGWDYPAKSPSWGSYYNQLTDSDYDGFGISVSVVDDIYMYYNTYFDDNTGSELIQRFADVNKTTGSSGSPFILNGGGRASLIHGGIQVIYDKEGHGAEKNNINLMGHGAHDLIRPGTTITAIYFNKTRQMVIFDSSKTLYISDAYSPSVYDSSEDDGCYLYGYFDGGDVCSTYVYQGSTSISLFRIKYKTEEESNG